MPDSARVITSIALSPNNTSSFVSATVRQTFAAQAAPTVNGTLQTLSYQVAAGTPLVINIPANCNLVAMFVDDAVNPQPIQVSGSNLNGTGYTQQIQLSATSSYIGPWLPQTNGGGNGTMTFTNQGSGTTTVRLFLWV